MLGRPGVGKTTMLREAARVLADELRKRVVIVDTCNEIAGDGDIPHPSIGRARRMQVPTPTAQHGVMIEAVENHMPEVIVIDEIGTELEAAAARTIAERGVQLIGTAHGNTLENLMLNPTLSDLIGGIQSVTLSRRGGAAARHAEVHPGAQGAADLLRDGRTAGARSGRRLSRCRGDGRCDAARQTVEPEVRQRLDDGGYEILAGARRASARRSGPRAGDMRRSRPMERAAEPVARAPAGTDLRAQRDARRAETVSPMERLTRHRPRAA